MSKVLAKDRTYDYIGFVVESNALIRTNKRGHSFYERCATMKSWISSWFILTRPSHQKFDFVIKF